MHLILFHFLVVILAGFGGSAIVKADIALKEGRTLESAGAFVWGSLCFGVSLALLNIQPGWVVS